MVILPDYEINEILHENDRLIVYRGYSVKNRMPVVIKAIKKEAVNPLGIALLIHEYEITHNLEIDGIVKPVELIQSRPLYALVMKDMEAVSLREFMLRHSIDLHDFLDIAVQLTEALGKLHQSRVIHRDLKPENIIFNPRRRKCCIIDFSNAALLPGKGNNVKVAEKSAGTPEYMSPEQTGQLNIGVDGRSDLYSLGVVFYEIITGQIPFRAEGPEDWAYEHITRKPVPPKEINSFIPSAISNIIMKLLNKDPEERYQSAYGLLWDLRECKKQLEEAGQITRVPVGRMDDFTRFHLPDKIYGRNHEIDTLKAAYRRVCAGRSETILVSGEPGIGKTMLVKEGLKSCMRQKEWFIAGKADQLQKNIPYALYADAFGKLIKQLMTWNRDKLAWWKKKILHSLGRNCAVITEIIPELEWIIGKQPPAEPLLPQEAENRFLYILRDFIKVFVWKGHPMVLFLDDLQWADPDSIKLLKYLMQDTDLNYLLIVGAFRENELEEGHPLLKILEESREQNGQDNRVGTIVLSTLNINGIEAIIADTLGAHLQDSEPLVQWLYRKSAGNPFALRQFLRLIYDEGLLSFDMDEGRWKWDLEAVQSLQQGEDVLELISRKIQMLPDEAQEALMLASCYGNRFDLKTLAALWSKPMDETAAALMPSIHEGFVIVLDTDDGSPNYEFLHDRVQQAVYSQISEEEKKRRHVMIGSYLLENAPDSNIEDRILFIMDHFNRGLELIQDHEKRIQLAGYNLIAGRKARTSAAYASALQYLRCASLLMPEDAWQRDHILNYHINLEYAQALYLCADTENAEKLFDTCLKMSQTAMERADVYASKMVLCAGIGKLDEAVHIGIKALNDLGMRIPIHPTKFDFARELFLYRWYMRNKSIEDLLLLPDMKDERLIKVSELLSRLCYVTMSTFPELYSFIVVKTGNFAVRHGNSELSSVGYLGYGITAGSLFGDYKAGERYGKVSLQLAEKYNLSSSKCIANFVVGSLLSHWTSHASIGLDYLRESAAAGAEAGNIVVAGYSHCLLIENQYIMGVPLKRMMEVVHEKNEILKKTKHHHLCVNNAIYDTVVSALTGQNADALAAVIAELEKGELLDLVQKDQSSLATYYVRRMQIHYMAGNYRTALSMSQKIRPIIGAIMGFMVYAEYYFYDSLIITSVYNELSSREKRLYGRILRKNLRMLKKWAQSCKDNFEHKYLLVCAQAVSLKNKREKAMLFYDRAIRSAYIYGYIQNEALANELAARFYLAAGMDRIAQTYMTDACKGYKKWGAIAKVNDLKAKYPDILHGIYVEKEKDPYYYSSSEAFNTALPTNGQMDDNSDSYYISKAIESIRGETDINKLLEGFLDIVVKSINADSSYLIFEKGGDLFIEVMRNTDSSKAAATTIPLDEYDDIAKSVVNYVARTLDTTVINSEDEAGIFASDAYIKKSGCKSIACLPLLCQGIPFGVMYLENSFLPGAFAPKRLEIVKLLSMQIAYAKKLQDYIIEEHAGNKEVGQASLIEPLTERETEILNLIAKGMSNKEIANFLDITVNTVKGHIKNIYAKLGVNRRLQTVTKARALKLLKDQ